MLQYNSKTNNLVFDFFAWLFSPSKEETKPQVKTKKKVIIRYLGNARGLVKGAYYSAVDNGTTYAIKKKGSTVTHHIPKDTGHYRIVESQKYNP